MWITGVPAVRAASARRATFSTTFWLVACAGAPESANAPPSMITSFWRSWMIIAAAPASIDSGLSFADTRPPSSVHVAEAVAADLQRDPVHRGGRRDVERAPVLAAPVEVADALRHLDDAELL